MHEKHQSSVSSASSLAPRDACPPQQRPLSPTSDGPLSKAIIVERYSDVFTGIGNLRGEIHLETDPSVPPVQLPPRRLPEPIKNEVKQELDALCRNKIIAPVNAPTDGRTAEADDDYQLLLRQIALGWPESPTDVPATLRQFMTFLDELAECDGLVFIGHRVV